MCRPAVVPLPPSSTDPNDEDGAKAYGSTACRPTQAKPQWASGQAKRSSLESASLSRKLALAGWRPFSISNLFTGTYIFSVFNCWKTWTLKLDDGLVRITTLCHMICR